MDPKFGKRGLRILPLAVDSAALGHLDPSFGGAGELLPGGSGSEISIVPGKGRRAIVLDYGDHECRGYCSPTPRLFSFVEGG